MSGGFPPTTAETEEHALERAPTMGPARVRALRGGASRAAFARQLGVTPHTVYRWELPDGATEARRPRGAELRKLLELASSPTGREPGAQAHGEPEAGLDRTVFGRAASGSRLAAEDVSLVLPALERVFGGDLARAHAELVQLLVKHQGLSSDALALARFGVAVLELLQRSDPRAALLVISPALADAESGKLADGVQARVFGAAAVLHALPDATLFDLGRVNAYAARADALAGQIGPEARCLGCLALLSAATVAADRELLERAYRKLEESGFINLPPLLDLHVEEFKAIRPVLSAKSSVSVRDFEAIAERAEQRGYHLLLARVLGHQALGMLENLNDPERVLAVARRARQIGRAFRIGPGAHVLLAIRAEAESLLRLGKTEEAFAALSELDAWFAETGMVPVSAVPVQSRLFFLTGRHDQLLLLTERLRRCELPALRSICEAYAATTEAIALSASADDTLATVAAYERAEAEAVRWPYLLRFVLIHRVIAHIIAGQDGAARLSLRRAQRYVDVYPSAWASAHLRRFEGILLASQGHWIAGRQLLESAIATFDLAQDISDAALCRHVVAVFGVEFEDQSGSSVAETRRALDAIGVVPPRSLEVGIALLREHRRSRDVAGGSRERLQIEDLVVPIGRLAARGVAPALLLRELSSIVSAWFSDREVRLEEIDSSGNARPIGGRMGPEAQRGSGEGFDWVEFGDGSGRLLRIGVQGELSPHERASLSLLTMATSLALEAATLRGVSDPFEAIGSEDRAPEIPGFVAASPEMRKLRSELVRLAASRATVIVSGESGSGKEVVARAIHLLSARAKESYVPFNCSSVPRDLFEGQLFGYRRGAFTGATSDHPGVIRAADGGTLFLDEIAELPLDVQPKLLRFLENAEVFPLGDQKPTKVDVRVIAATHRDLLSLMRAGRFREDLYYRLQVVPIFVPPLRSRLADIPVLARYFLREISGHAQPPLLAPDALAALLAHPWPGNVRELRNVIERALAFAPVPDVLTAKHLRLLV